MTIFPDWNQVSPELGLFRPCFSSQLIKRLPFALGPDIGLAR